MIFDNGYSNFESANLNITNIKIACPHCIWNKLKYETKHYLKYLQLYSL